MWSDSMPVFTPEECLKEVPLSTSCNFSSDQVLQSREASGRSQKRQQSKAFTHTGNNTVHSTAQHSTGSCLWNQPGVVSYTQSIGLLFNDLEVIHSANYPCEPSRHITHTHPSFPLHTHTHTQTVWSWITNPVSTRDTALISNQQQTNTI